MVVERREWGNLYGYLRALKDNGETLELAGPDLWEGYQRRVKTVSRLYQEIEELQTGDIGAINYQIERLRLKDRSIELGHEGEDVADLAADIQASREGLQQQYAVLQQRLGELYQATRESYFVVETMDGQQVEVPIANVVRAYRPNDLGIIGKLVIYVERLWEFFTAQPREANTEGGIFPAIFGTILMVLLMTVFVTPFGVVAAVYLREYARQGLITRTIRVAVNNLAGVPSIVYGVFGLGFFVYFLGGNIDQLFFPEAMPAPTFGTPGLMWASLTLALLTLPVVIVATEEGLARIPRSLREGSMALGATRFQTLWNIILPAASPALMTGLILAVARAAGEVAPLMLVGVVKLAPTLPLDGNFPFLHLERKFMHLGFHIYDVGFQSPNVEAARPLVYATALLLVGVIAALNLTAVGVRNYLREKYKALEM
jgi:phosphate transport system permease protein